MYLIYLKKILLPVTPKSWSISHNNKNTTMTLINEGEVNILKEPGLEAIKFDAMLPNARYPFARYLSGYRDAEYYINQFNKMIKSQKPFQLNIIREKQDRSRLKSTNIKVAFEGNITYKESTDEGIDVIATITLKKYKPYGLKTYTLPTPIVQNTTPVVDTTVVAMTQTQRTTENSPLPTQTNTYVVKAGDSLYKIAKYFYNDGAQFHKIFLANQDKISNPSLIYPGQVLTIPKIITSTSSSEKNNSGGGTGGGTR